MQVLLDVGVHLIDSSYWCWGVRSVHSSPFAARAEVVLQDELTAKHSFAFIWSFLIALNDHLLKATTDSMLFWALSLY